MNKITFSLYADCMITSGDIHSWQVNTETTNKEKQRTINFTGNKYRGPYKRVPFCHLNNDTMQPNKIKATQTTTFYWKNTVLES